MAKKRSSAKNEAHDGLLTMVREAKTDILDVTARDTAIEPISLESAFEQILDLVAEPDVTPKLIDAFHDEGVRLARTGALGTKVLDAYLSLNWAIWEAAMQQHGVDREIVLGLADRLMKGIDSAIAALAAGYAQVELELATAHSERRRSVLEELLVAPRATPEDRARIRRRAERHGLGADDDYRMILIATPGLADDALDEAIDRLEPHVRVPVSHHRSQPGIRLPVVLEWRGRILVLAASSWTREGRLREALPQVVEQEWVAIDSGTVAGIHPLADALAQAEFALGVASDLGRRGWIGDAGTLALETTFLLDQELMAAAIEQELGALLADERMGEELIETLEVYLGARQNIRETARRLHLAPRTVAYRLERIETLLGHELEGESISRIGAALLGLRVTRQAGRSTPVGGAIGQTS